MKHSIEKMCDKLVIPTVQAIKQCRFLLYAFLLGSPIRNFLRQTDLQNIQQFSLVKNMI